MIPCPKKAIGFFLFVLLLLCGRGATWTADNGNGTFTNPLFYDEFSDPDLIRVGGDFYLTGTTMHTMPGLPVLHSVDLVNWELLGYAFDRLDLGPEYRLENGREAYGQGIWAPSFRYHDGTFYIFTNANGHTTQLFRSKNPAGPWRRVEMKQSLHDLSVLFDDDGKTYVVWGYQGIQIAELNRDLTDFVPGTRRTLIEKSQGMGEGLHFYKINGRYFITSAWFAGRMRMACARAEKPGGPYEVNLAISSDEDFGLAEGNRLQGVAQAPFQVVPGNPASRGHMSLHQGGLVDTPTGEWWGFSMMDYNSVGRLTALSPVTWQDGWPYFGLTGNLGRTPRTWVKPNTGKTSPPVAPYQRNDDFAGPKLAHVWQWNHLPDDARWSLAERPGFLRLHSLPAPDLWWARNTLSQRAIGPASVVTVELETNGLIAHDIAGLALLNLPYAWIGVHVDHDGALIEQFNQLTNQSARAPLPGKKVWLRVDCDFLKETGAFSYSLDGKTFSPLGGETKLVFQLKTFQGVRYSLFNFNTGSTGGGYADFTRFAVDELRPHGIMRPIPYGGKISLAVHGQGTVLEGKFFGVEAGRDGARFTIVDRGLGRVALRTGAGRFISVAKAGENHRVTLRAGEPNEAETFQWTETVYGDLMLLSMASHRYLHVDPTSGTITADDPGPSPDRADGACFDWSNEEFPR